MSLILRLLTLVAVLAMPLGMTAPAAGHAAPSMNMPMHHCPQQDSNHHSKGVFTECTMACSAALPATAVGGAEPLPMTCAPTVPAAQQVLRGLHPETATPPPKNS